MSWKRMSLLKKIAGTIMAITIISTVTLRYTQYRLYTNNFATGDSVIVKFGVELVWAETLLVIEAELRCVTSPV